MQQALLALKHNQCVFVHNAATQLYSRHYHRARFTDEDRKVSAQTWPKLHSYQTRDGIKPSVCPNHCYTVSLLGRQGHT